MECFFKLFFETIIAIYGIVKLIGNFLTFVIFFEKNQIVKNDVNASVNET